MFRNIFSILSRKMLVKKREISSEWAEVDED